MKKVRFLFLVALFLLLVPFVCRTDAAQGEGKKRYARSVASYQIPDVVLTNQEGQRVRLRELLTSEKPVFLQFIYATCTTICPILSAGYTNLQNRLGPDLKNVRFVSVSIDPEHDTPGVMKDYLKRYSAKPGWDFLTGSREDIDQVMGAFDAYVPNKMAHYPLTLLRSPADGRWIRLYGLMSTQELMEEYQKVWKK